MSQKSDQNQENQSDNQSTWFSENIIDIDKIATDIVSKCDRVDMATEGTIANLNYCAGTVASESMQTSFLSAMSSVSAVRISQEEVPSDEEPEAIEVEYIPTDQMESFSVDQELSENSNSVLMHFNSKTAGSLPLTQDSFLAVSMNDSSREYQNDSNSSRCYTRKY